MFSVSRITFLLLNFSVIVANCTEELQSLIEIFRCKVGRLGGLWKFSGGGCGRLVYSTTYYGSDPVYNIINYLVGMVQV